MDCIEGVTPKCEEGDEEDPEELRCFYVAITRAKNELYLMIPRYYNMRNCRGVVSHFINKTDVLNTTQRNIQNNELLKMCQKEIYHF